MRTVTLLMAMALACAAPLQAFAHAHLVASTPAVGATVPSVSELAISFSEGIELGLSKFELTGPGGTTVAATATLDPADNKLVRIRLKAPLAAGTYTVHWHVVSVDTHRTEGTYGFTVS